MDTEHPTRSDEDPALEDIARESHSPVVEVAQLYANEMRKLSVGARIKGYLSIFALRNVRKKLLNRSLTKGAPSMPGDPPETGHPATDTLLPRGQPIPIKPSATH
jgi:hypothetical protein